MSLTLKETITATQTTIDVNGTDTLSNGDLYTIEDEQVFIVTAATGDIQPGQTAWQRLNVQRGQLGTTEVGHTAGTAVTLVDIPLGAGGGVVTVYQQTTTLTNAQIKALPTTPIEILSAPGVGKISVILGLTIAFSGTEGVGPSPVAYTNLNGTTCLLYTLYGAGPAAAGQYDETLNGSLASPAVGSSLFVFPQYAAVAGGFVAVGAPGEGYANAPITIQMDNGVSGALTGGHANNAFGVSVIYAVIDA